MNIMTEEQYRLWLDNTNDKELNKLMIEEFPFLLPRNRWTDEVSEDFSYSYNEFSWMPHGWAAAFGWQMLCEIKEQLIKENFLDKYRITQIKEKYGSLRWYDRVSSQALTNIIIKYCRLSSRICIHCGKVAKYETRGWVECLCEDCFKGCNSEYEKEEIEENRQLLETNEFFTFQKHLICKGHLFELYLDDYGMSYHLAWRDPLTKEVREWSCGMCNDYFYEMNDIAQYLNERFNKKLIKERDEIDDDE